MSDIVPHFRKRTNVVKPSQDLKIHNYELYSLYQQVDHLPDEDQRALILVLDSLIKKSQMAEVMSRVAAS
jgi:hypothetical protein